MPSDLAAWRARLSWSQREAARQLGIQLKSYQELERGRRFGSGLPAPIDRRTRLACAALESGLLRLPALPIARASIGPQRAA